jgi:hypothetical protein
MEAIDVGGANLLLAVPKSWDRVSVGVSPDCLRLVCIYSVSDSFRVQRHKRGSMGPQWQEEWWLEHEATSITDTLASAQSLAASYLGSAA